MIYWCERQKPEIQRASRSANIFCEEENGRTTPEKSRDGCRKGGAEEGREDVVGGRKNGVEAEERITFWLRCRF